MTKRLAVITGIDGQDGHFLSELLVSEGYEVVGVGHPDHLEQRDAGTRRAAVQRAGCDITKQEHIEELLRRWQPTEFYNLAAKSSGAGMFDDPVAIGDINGLAVTGMLEAIRKVEPSIRFAQASSSEVFAQSAESPQNEHTPPRPRSPYGASKVLADTMLRIYRERYSLFACSAHLFNHESPHRRIEFVTRKVTHAAASIHLGLMSEIRLGNLDAQRDWGFAGDYMRAMWLMLQHSHAQDYVVATGRLHSVRDLCEVAFGHVGLDYREFVKGSTEHSRGADHTVLSGDASRARRDLGWTPVVGFRDMVTAMVDFDINQLTNQPPKKAMTS